ncbi:MAG: glycosyltransferase family 9 protein [Candidatus Omnitrophota bacterium]
MFKKILIYGHSNIGDVIYDLAVVGPVRKMYPEAEIVFLTSARCRDIADGYYGLDRVITFDRRGRDKGFIKGLRFSLNLRRERFDLVIVLKKSLNYIFLGAPSVWREKLKDRPEQKHPVDRYINMLASYGIPPERASFNFSVKEPEAGFCEEFFKKNGVGGQDRIGGILPLAAWSLKSWPVEKWNSLSGILYERYGIRLLNLGKFPGSEFGRSIAAKMSSRIIAGDKTSLAQAKALLKRCRFFIGPDSSLLHLASCMGIETIGLYGATSGEHFYPYFHQNNIIYARNRIPCMPCYPGASVSCCAGKAHYDFGPCMEGIEVADVLELIKKRMSL